MADLRDFVIRAEKAESEIALLEAQIKSLKDGCVEINNDNITPELAKLRTENAKLKFQITHLKKNIDMEESKSGSAACPGNPSDYMVSIKDRLTELFTSALNGAFPELLNPPAALTPSTKENFGDYQCNNAMNISQLLKAKGVKKPPREIAQAIVNALPSSDLIQKVEIAGPGFINIHLHRGFVERELSQLLKQGVKPPYTGPRKKVVIDMSSPNIAKEMHVGHLRSTVIGEGLAQLCMFVGHEVKKLNHLGDWGTQFGMLITYLIDTFPNYKTESPPIGDLMAFYRASKKRFDEDEDFKKRAYANVVKLQAYDADVIKAWNLICDESRKEFTKIYERLSITDLVDRGESYYQPMMPKIVERLDKAGLTKVEDGRKIVWAEGQEVPLTIVKSDGGNTYATSDFTALHHRLTEEKADWILYVIDQGQANHLQSVYSVSAQAGWYDPNHTRVEHVGFGVVLGEDRKKFKTRSGDTVRLVDLLDEGMKRSLSKLQEKEREKVLNADELKSAQEAVAYGCIKYADLAHDRCKDYVFSFDKMLDDKGNTAVYLLYAYTRIRSIARTAQVSDEAVAAAAATAQITLEHPREWKLAKLLLRFPEIILRAMEDLMLHSLCEFLYELATTFSEFYDVCYVVEKDRKTGEIKTVNMNRLLLCEASARVMAAGFKILGVQTVQKM